MALRRKGYSQISRTPVDRATIECEETAYSGITKEGTVMRRQRRERLVKNFQEWECHTNRQPPALIASQSPGRKFTERRTDSV